MHFRFKFWLEYTEIYKLLASLWEKTLAKAKIALQEGDESKALSLFEYFKHIPLKNTIIKKTILDYSEFSKFASLAKDGKLLLAYSLANAHSDYKDSQIYRALETKWKNSFSQAQKHALELKGVNKAKEILAPYRGVSEKTKTIQDLLAKGEVYKRFQESLGKKDFKTCFGLIKQHSFLKEFPEYDVMMKYGDALYIKSQQLILSGDTHLAIKMLEVLSDFDDYKEESKELMLDIDVKQKFFNAVEEKDTPTAYNLMAKQEYLQETAAGHKLQSDWNKDLLNANAYAVKGDAIGVQAVLKIYMKTSSKHISLATVFALCYMSQLESAIKNKTSKSDMENGIKNYLFKFGKKEQIKDFYRLFKTKYPDSKLSVELLTQGSLSMWRPSMIVKSILE